MFLIGTIFLVYPVIINFIYNQDIKRVQGQYFENIEIGDSLADLYNLLYLYNIELYKNKQSKLIDPFSYSQPNFDLSEYGISDNCIGFISIDKINITLPIYLGANRDNMKKGAVHLTQTSFPIGGKNTNSVIAAHRGSVYSMFRNIHKLEIGDYIIIKNFKELLEYQVCEIKIINPWDVDELLIQEGRDLITLISCHPFSQNSQRYVVYCERIV